MKTLREKIEESKAWYLQKYGALDWRLPDVGLSFSIAGYLCILVSIFVV